MSSGSSPRFSLPSEREGGAQRRKGDTSTESILAFATASVRASPFRPSGTFSLRRKVKVALLFAGTLALAACMDPQYSREGATDDQKRQDEARCKVQVDELMIKERAIVDDREATIGATDRMGRTQLPQQMAARDDRNRSVKLMENCMTARGWTAKKSKPF